MRAPSAGWRSCTTTQTPTLWWCWWGTSQTCRASGPSQRRKPNTLQANKLKSFHFYQLVSVLTSNLDWSLDEKGLMFMETSALDSTNVESAFHEVLTGTDGQTHFPCWGDQTRNAFLPRVPTAIHKKVASREVTRGSISAVTLSGPIGLNSEQQEERKGCCKGS